MLPGTDRAATMHEPAREHSSEFVPAALQEAFRYRVPEGILWCLVSGGAAPDLAGFPGCKEEAPVYDMR